jgi:hypothetical protein
VNPMVGSGLKYGRGVVREETVEVVRDHAGGTRRGGGTPGPKAAEEGTRRRGPRRSQDADLTAGYDGGELIDNRKRGNPASQPGRKDRKVSDKSAPRSGGSREPERKCWRADRSRVLEGHRAETHDKVRGQR